mmetsp:Transcript_62828/g.70274  ORF Transcript_62828/g.70274 Transcript_62828/m.70274 type:complete len:629 (+) Transcript_62828:107-1993(+)
MNPNPSSTVRVFRSSSFLLSPSPLFPFSSLSVSFKSLDNIGTCSTSSTTIITNTTATAVANNNKQKRTNTRPYFPSPYFPRDGSYRYHSNCNLNINININHKYNYNHNYNYNLQIFYNYYPMLVGNSTSTSTRSSGTIISLVSSLTSITCCCSVLLIFILLGGGGRGSESGSGSSSGADVGRGKATFGYILFAEALLLQKPVMTTTSSASSSHDETIQENRGKHHPEENQLLLFHFESTTSTQDEAKKIVEQLQLPISDSESKSESDFISTTTTTNVRTFCVTSTIQSNGKGTSGRKWLGSPGNVYVTIGIPVNVWMQDMMRRRNIPLTLLPLKIGDLTASLINTTIQQGLLLDDDDNIDDDNNNNDNYNDNDFCENNNHKSKTTTTKTLLNEEKQSQPQPIVTVKWPNDVLVDGKKISGTLIESQNGWFLIGIGINVAYAPTISTTGIDYGRPSVCINEYKRKRNRDYNRNNSDNLACSDNITNIGDDSNENSDRSKDQLQEERKQKQQHEIDVARDLGVQLALDFHRWIYNNDESFDKSNILTSESIVHGWKQWLDWDTELIMRNDDNPPTLDDDHNDEDHNNENRYQNQKQRVVKIVDVLPDGRIRVQNQDESGRMEDLISDYFV